MKGDWRDVLLFDPLGSHVTNTSLGSVVTLTPPATATKLLIQALAQNVRIKFDNADPSATVGFQLKSEDPMLLIPLGDEMIIKVIQETAGAIIDYQWAI